MEPQTPTEYVLDVIAANDVPFRVVYGKRRSARGYIASYPTVAFYDRRYPMDIHGQFVSDYMSDDFLSHGPYDLDLAGDVPAWKVDWYTLRAVREWLHFILTACID